jgi:hypothetical protein
LIDALALWRRIEIPWRQIVVISDQSEKGHSDLTQFADASAQIISIYPAAIPNALYVFPDPELAIPGQTMFAQTRFDTFEIERGSRRLRTKQLII